MTNDNAPGHDGAPSVPRAMRAMVMREFGGPEVLRLEETSPPVPGRGEAVVRVAAVEVSRNRDIATRTGLHPFSRELALPHVLGGDFSGVVAAVGDGVDPALVGRRVGVMNHHVCGRCSACRSGASDDCSNLEMVGIHRWGSYAEYTSVHTDGLHTLPEDVDMVQAAALAATGPVGLTQLRTAEVGPGSVVLITGMTGALASCLAALCAALGAQVIGLSRRPAALAEHPGVIALDVRRPDLSEAILAASNGVRPRAVIDNVCAPGVFQRHFPVLANGARIVVSGVIGDPELPVLPVPARDLYSRSIGLLGVRSHTEAVTAEFWRMVHDGFRLPATSLHEYPFETAPDVHAAVTSGETSGHTILRVDRAIR